MSGLSVAKNVPVTGARWTISRLDGAYIDLPKGFEIVDPGLSRRYTASDRLRRDGGTVIGDGTFEPRSLTIKYDAYATVDQTFRDTLNAIEGFFRDTLRPFYLLDNNNSIRAEIIPTSNKMAQTAGAHNRHARFTLSLEMPDALWEANDVIIIPDSLITGSTGISTGAGVGTTGGATGYILEDEDQITLNNECEFDVFPIFTITPMNNIINFRLFNATTDGGFEFESNDLTTNTTLIVNAVTGSITLDGVEKSSAMSEGGFITLAPGNNVIKYESDNGDIILKSEWRLRYAY